MLLCQSCIPMSFMLDAGSALTTFNKGSDNLQPKVIALRSMQYTSGEMLFNPNAYAEFKDKVNINDEVSSSTLSVQNLCGATRMFAHSDHLILAAEGGFVHACLHLTSTPESETFQFAWIACSLHTA